MADALTLYLARKGVSAQVDIIGSPSIAGVKRSALRIIKRQLAPCHFRRLILRVGFRVCAGDFYRKNPLRLVRVGDHTVPILLLNLR